MKICRDTKSFKGCREEKPNVEFMIVRTNKTTGESYRMRMCNECRKKSRRTRKQRAPADEADIFKAANELMNDGNLK